MRGVKRIFSISRYYLAQWLLEAADSLPKLSDTLVKWHPGDVLELDELWSFVLKKSQKRWVWLALCRRTRQIVAYTVGDRSEKTCRELWEQIPREYKDSRTYSDFWDAYRKVFPEDTHQSVGKESGELITLNVGTTPCVRDWADSFASLYLFPSQTASIKRL